MDTTTTTSEGGNSMEGENLQGQPQPQGQGSPAQGAATAQQQGTELMIPKRRFDEVTQKFNEAEARLAEALKEVEAAKSKDSKISELEQKIKDMEASYALKEATAKKMSAIDKAIGDTSVDPDVVKKLLDLDKITLDEKDGLKGFEEQYKELQKNKAYLFKKAAPIVPPGAGKATTQPESFAKTLAKEKVKAGGIVAKSKNYFS